EKDERITGILSVRNYDPDYFVFMATREGTVKKTSLDAFSRPRSNGIIALGLHEDDELIGAVLTDGSQEMILAASSGRAIRIAESDVRAMGRTAAGVRGMRLKGDNQVIAVSRAVDGALLIASAHGCGTRTAAEAISSHGRALQRVKGNKKSESI